LSSEARPNSGTTVRLPTPSAWVLANANGAGFYRVHYEDGNYAALTQLLKNERTFSVRLPSTVTGRQLLSPLDRASLLDDTFAHLYSNRVNVSVAFELLDYVRSVDETSLCVWETLVKHLARVATNVRGTPVYDMFKVRYINLDLCKCVQTTPYSRTCAKCTHASTRT